MDVFPSLCCECMGVRYVKENNEPCILQNKMVGKVCCSGTNKERILTWRCCQPEPPCPSDCCKCDIDDCPFPNVRGRFYFSIPIPVPNFVEYLKQFSGIVQG